MKQQLKKQEKTDFALQHPHNVFHVAWTNILDEPETFVRKAYSLNTHDFMNTNWQSFITAITKKSNQKSNHLSSIREPDIDFRKVVDKKRAENPMELEESRTDSK